MQSENNWQYFWSDQDSREWHIAREEFYTASLIPEIFDLGFRSWISLIEKREVESNEVLEWGKEHEEDAVNSFLEWKKDCALAVRPGFLTLGKIGASLDRIIFVEDQLFNLEIKCPFPKYSTVPDDVKDIKPRILLQCIIQMGVSGIHSTFLYFWQPTKQSCFRVEFDDKLFTWILEQVEKINLILKEKPKKNPFKKEKDVILNFLCNLNVKKIY